ncbi:hypothetical protein CJD36_012340 [Flavipsychrobacter stenotrophus]|uniref:Glycosyltransferase 2-like domain-containing protein n=1 Tax=Flavipsychrobacter stenotrophus TaxID=2077091 RepID=A0A2S7SV35_9BACT|nr:glycosyltransferase [Flavipsychrobacter stenotrophus]PQJ10753.1 hypothetical protein CJD36_012340 [Flavipsychrobacter stenotrophus]
MDVSVIIPCYNSGCYLGDALQSVAASKNLNGYQYEVIIVDDGSTDKDTLDMLNKLHDCTVIHQDNKGPGAARNTGVNAAKGEFILFLDSDNKIRDGFMARGIGIFNSTTADIVYGKPAFFGATTTPRFKTGEFDMESILVMNHIDMCSMVRKSAFDELGGFDEDRKLIAFEDWDLWIRAGAAQKKFHFVDEVMFDYRITNHSLLDDEDNHCKVVDILYTKHKNLVLDTFRKIGIGYSVYRKDEKRPFRTFFKNCYYKYLYRFINIHALAKRH